MREAKFRAWDGIRKKMSEPFNLYMLKDGYFIDREGTAEASTFILSDCDILQYTGLKDKNGEKIYEGDVVKGIFYEGKLETMKIEWHERMAGFIISGYPMHIHGLHGVEVIGNIYENPELLKGNKNEILL